MLNIFRYSIIIYLVQTYNIFSSWAEETINTMSLPQKIGQLFVVATASVPRNNTSVYQTDQCHIEKLITEYHIGGLLFLFEGNVQEQIKLYHHYNNLSQIPLLCVQDLEWGLSMRLKNVMRFPKQIALGYINDNRLLTELGKEIARQCKAIHVHMNLAPVVDVNTNINNPIIGKRAFGSNPELVCSKAAALIHGFQEEGILTCAKHFPGHGDTSVDSHTDIPIIPYDKQRLEDIELKPFAYLLNQVDAIMIGHLKVPVYDKMHVASMSKKIVTEILRETMNFKGLIITDGLGMRSVNTPEKEPGEIELQALLAGNDILLAPVNVPAAVQKIKEAIEKGIITEQEIDAHVLRILKAKEKADLPNHTTSMNKDIFETLHTKEAYDLQKKIYQATIQIKGSKSILRDTDTQKEITLLQYNESTNNCFLEQCTNFYSSVKHYFVQTNTALYDFRNTKTVILYIFDTKKITNETLKDIANLIKNIKTQKTQVAIIFFDTAHTTAWCEEADLIVLAHEDTIETQKAVAEALFYE